MGYLKQTASFGLLYKPNNFAPLLQMYSDSDHTSEHDLVSRLAYLGFMNGNLVSWKSKKLAQTVSMSSCESEFYTSELSGADAMFLRRMQFGLDPGSPPTSEEQMEPALLFMDNQAAIKVLQQDGFSNRTKHICEVSLGQARSSEQAFGSKVYVNSSQSLRCAYKAIEAFASLPPSCWHGSSYAVRVLSQWRGMWKQSSSYVWKQIRTLIALTSVHLLKP